jgi:hypothetical protein
MNEQERNPLVKRKKQAGTRSKRKPSVAEQLRRAANKALAENCETIANRLSTSSMEGNLQSTRLLYQLAELSDDRSEGDGVRKFRSMASKWASEPQWSGDQSEENSDPTQDCQATGEQLQHND